MKPVTSFLARLTLPERRRLILPSTIAAAAVIVVWMLARLAQASRPSEIGFAIGSAAAAVGYLLLLFFYLLPLAQNDRLYGILILIANGFISGLLWIDIPEHLRVLPAFLIVLVALTTAALRGRTAAYLYVGFTVLFYLFWLAVVFPQSWGGWEAFTAVPVLTALSVEAVFYLLSVFSAQVDRLETINQVARNVSSTIEPPEVISLVCKAVQNSLDADTYYMALYNGDMLRMELLYDDGKYYSTQDYPLGNGPSSWVIRNRMPILLGDVAREAAQYGIVMNPVGSSRRSVSWMGAPMLIGDTVLGLIAVASYRRNAFTNRELELLTGIALQAALAVDNAAHHSQVEEASRLDSLTQVYNHGYFLQVFNEIAQYSKFSGSVFSLIMIDIDHFKTYNDTFGHQVGDCVLVTLVETVRESIRSVDIIGRWGGEEFVVLLQEAGGRQAYAVAERISRSLAKLELTDREGRPLPPPTISQGIAVFPTEADDVESLIQLADKRLYQAKHRGRNQVEPTPDHWMPESKPD